VSGGDIVPRFGQEEQLVDDYTLEMGGSTCIFACQAAKLGMRVGIMGKVGRDYFGRLILKRLRSCGVDIRYVTIEKKLKTGLGIALCKENDRSILTIMGSLNALEPGDVTAKFLNTTRHLHHGSFFLQTGLKPGIPNIFRAAKKQGITTSLDTNWDPAENWNSTLNETLSLTDIFMPNKQELLHITKAESLEDGIKTLHEAGVRIVVLKMGETGALLSSEGQFHYCKVTPVVGGDSVGAGDSFDAGFLAGWLRGLPLPSCLRLACGCGRSVARQIGGLRGQPSWEQALVQITDLKIFENWGEQG